MTTAARKKQKTGGASAGPTIFRKKQKVGGVTTGPQDLMFANSTEHGHLVHMAVQHKYTKDGETHCGFAYASFPTLRDMVAYADTFAAGQPQCLFELAREGTVVAPYMDIDCTLDRPAPELLSMVRKELIAFTKKHLGTEPQIWITDSSRSKPGGRYKNSRDCDHSRPRLFSPSRCFTCSSRGWS